MRPSIYVWRTLLAVALLLCISQQQTAQAIAPVPSINGANWMLKGPISRTKQMQSTNANVGVRQVVVRCRLTRAANSAMNAETAMFMATRITKTPAPGPTGPPNSLRRKPLACMPATAKPIAKATEMRAAIGTAMEIFARR